MRDKVFTINDDGRICENGKRYDIQRVKLGDLEKEVKRRNLKWKRIDNGGVLNIV